jgi:adenylylsulfate kinase
MLIAMAGLPGTGKSTVAARLAQELGGVVLSKDAVRAALFPPPVLDYSTAQDDLCMAAIYRAAAHILTATPERTVIVDGRTFLRPGQIDDLRALVASLGAALRIIKCMCDDETARERLESDLAHGRHPAGNRTYDLYLAVKCAARPLPLPHLLLDTGTLSVEVCVRECLAYLRRQPAFTAVEQAGG